MEFSRPGVRWDEMSQLSLLTMDSTMTPSERERIRRYRDLWNHYEGYHWEDIVVEDKPQVTINYCRRFVDKFSSFLFSLHSEADAGFTVKVPTEMEAITLPFLNSVWDADYNGRARIASSIAQMGGVSGDAYIMVRFEEPGEFSDPFREYPDGRIRIIPLSSHTVFPTYDPSDKDRMISCEIKYPRASTEERGFLTRATRTMFGKVGNTTRMSVYRQVWTDDEWIEYENDVVTNRGVNRYGIIPIVHIPNIASQISNYGISDLEDIVPLNKEINFKVSDNSEVIDYHSAPVTVVFGAKVSSMERGANKVWGNLPKDSKVENLRLEGDLSASVSHIRELKKSMFEIASVPESSLGGERAISNTSGIALQIEFSPLLEKIGLKRITYGRGLRKVSRLILLIGERENMITIPEEVVGTGTSNAFGNDIPETKEMGTWKTSSSTASSGDTNVGATTLVTDPNVIRRMFYDVAIQFPESLPKDKLFELEQIQAEINLELEDRRGALKRLGKENVEQKIAEIDRSKMRDAELEADRMRVFMSNDLQPPGMRSNSRVVSGYGNSPEPKPDVVKAEPKGVGKDNRV